MLFLERYADLHHAASDRDWTQAFFAHANRLGFANCLYATIPHVKAPLASIWVRSSFPEVWLERYFGRGYAAADFKVTHCMTCIQPFLWVPDAFVGAEQRRIYEEGCEFGLRAGISLPVLGPGGVYGQLCLSNDVEPDSHFRRYVEERLPEILVLRETLMYTSRQFAYPSGQPLEQELTVRELQCLRLAATGKNSRQIGLMLGCTAATINFHLANARKKLGAPTRQAAVVKAVQSGKVIF
jgi:LuxR family quorum-sensing transcriptional regulator LasR